MPVLWYSDSRERNVTMLFSICIPVYNTSKYLDECLQSVLCQTETDYEIVLVNDGSTDASPQMCDRYAAQYPNIRVIHKENEGLMMTRRRGFREARGDYFICLDSDDYLRSAYALERIRNMIEAEKCDLVVYDYIVGKENPKDNRTITLFDHPDGYIFDESNKWELYEKLLIGKWFNQIWIKAASRKIVDVDVDYSQWKPDICRGEDMFQSYPMLTNATRIGYIKEPFVHYRWTPGSISNNPKLKYYYAYRAIYRREDEYLPLWNLGAETDKKAKLRRIPQILSVLIIGYHASKKAGQLAQWKEFIAMVSEDPFFRSLYPEEYRKDISGYYRLLGKLIMKNNTFLLARTLDAYQWYCENLKHKK